MNEQVFNLLEGVSEKTVDLTDKSQVVEGIEKIPDGMLTVKRSNKKNLDYKLQINDYAYY